MSFGPLAAIWRLLHSAERRAVAKVFAVIVLGLALELVSFTALLPAMSIISKQMDVDSRFFGLFIRERSESFVVLSVVAALTFVYVLKSLYVAWSIWYQREFCRRIELRLTSDALRYYLFQPYLYHVGKNSAVLIRDMGFPNQFVALSLDSLLVLSTDGALMFALIGLLVIIEPQATLMVLAIAAVVGFGFHRLTRRQVESWGRRRMDLDAKKIQIMQEGFSAIKELKAMECEEEFAKRFDKNVGEATRIGRNYLFLTSMPRIWLELLAFIGLGVLLVVLTSGGRSLVEALPELTIFAASAFRILPAVNRIIFAIQNLRYGRASVESLLQIESDSSITKTLRPSTLHNGEIRLENVCFNYPGKGNTIIDDVSLSIEAGKLVGISGDSGTGKSTLACLLLGLLQPNSGAIAVGGLNVKGPVGRQIGYVPQSVYLVDDSIRNNVAFGVGANEAVDEHRVHQVLRQARLDELVSSLAEGVHYVVGENGSKLSGGQRQRVGIARALYSDPPIVIFDEATSSLDSVSAREILDQIVMLRGAKTLLVISHDEKVLSMCDSVFELSNGKMKKIREQL